MISEEFRGHSVAQDVSKETLLTEVNSTETNMVNNNSFLLRTNLIKVLS